MTGSPVHPPHSMLPANRAAPRRAASAPWRRRALMASVALGLGAASFGLTVPQARADLFGRAQAQVSSDMSKVQRPAGFADVVERVKPSVISVRVKMGEKSGNEKSARRDRDRGDEDSPFAPGSPLDRFFRRFGGPDGMPGMRGPRFRERVTGQGSGFFISADGFAVTNNHVVDGADTVEVMTDDSKTYTAKVIGVDPRTDVALIKIDGRSDFPFAKLSDNAPRIGDWVLAVGNPFGLGGTVTAGIVSARGRDIGNGPYDDFIQIDAPVNKGNSGGPAFNTDGEVIGVNTAIFSPSGGSVGIAFAIPSTTVKSVVAQLKDKGSVTRGWIGVQIQTVTPEIAESLGLKRNEGALVAEPQANGPAVKAGVEAGDVITAVNDKPVRDARDLARTIGAMPPGTSIKLTLMRKGTEKTVSVMLGELPNVVKQSRSSSEGGERRGTDLPRLGVTVAPAASVAGAGKDGVVITSVEPNSAAAERGVKEGDVILDVGGKAVSSADEVRDALSAARADGKASVLIRLRSGDASRFIALPVGRG
ncbi:MAG: Do family serine endopeptidase [Xanthobacteraceae bacterium]|nr:MAG: Do family serine endopeptidase [Xanthobacteraceae bacterium]